MNKDLEILVQKFMNDDLDAEERVYLETIKHSEDWKRHLADFEQLEYDLDKSHYLEEQRSRLKSIAKKGKQKKWLLYAGTGIAAALVVGLIVFDFNKEPDRIAQENIKTNGEAAEAVDEYTEGDDAYSKEHAENAAFIESDYDLLDNRSIHSFGEGNGAFKRLKASVTDSLNGILYVVTTYGAMDSVYVFTKSVNGIVYEKHLRYVGQTNNYLVFNLVNRNIDMNEAQKSIVLTKANFDYYGRYIVLSTDDLPDQTLPVGLLYEIEDNRGNWSHAIIEFGDEECLELPSGNTSCISFF